MDEIKRQVRIAYRRLVLHQFLCVVPWWLSLAMLPAMAAIAAVKIWPLSVDGSIWVACWIGGAAVGGLLLSAVHCCFAHRGLLDAAIEIDRRYGLKERVSSTLAMAEAELDTAAGRALLADALRQVQRIDVTERFQVSVGGRAVFPLLAAAAAFALALLVEDASRRQAAASPTHSQVKAQINKSASELKKRIAAQRRKAQSQGLRDAELILREFERGIDELKSSDQADRQRAMIKLNDLAKDLERRRRQLGGAEQLRQRLEQLKGGLDGPAAKIAAALRQGDFRGALNELEAIQRKIRQNELSEQDKQDLARQLEQMAQKLQQAADEHQRAKEDLQRRIKEKLEAGDVAEAGQLQQQLEQLEQQTEHMSRLNQMASQLGQCGKSLRGGDADEATGLLQQLAADLEDLQSELDELQTLDEASTQIAQAKSSMSCEKCGGGG